MSPSEVRNISLQKKKRGRAHTVIDTVSVYLERFNKFPAAPFSSQHSDITKPRLASASATMNWEVAIKRQVQRKEECSLILSLTHLPVCPMYTLPHERGIS